MARARLACVGDSASLTYKRSRRGDALVDRASAYVEGRAGGRLLDFVPGMGRAPVRLAELRFARRWPHALARRGVRRVPLLRGRSRASRRGSPQGRATCRARDRGHPRARRDVPEPCFRRASHGCWRGLYSGTGGERRWKSNWRCCGSATSRTEPGRCLDIAERPGILPDAAARSPSVGPRETARPRPLRALIFGERQPSSRASVGSPGPSGGRSSRHVHWPGSLSGRSRSSFVPCRKRRPWTLS